MQWSTQIYGRWQCLGSIWEDKKNVAAGGRIVFKQIWNPLEKIFSDIIVPGQHKGRECAPVYILCVV